jgi:hypothetical protein
LPPQCEKSENVPQQVVNLAASTSILAPGSGEKTVVMPARKIIYTEAQLFIKLSKILLANIRTLCQTIVTRNSNM